METEIEAPTRQRLKPGTVLVAVVALVVFLLDQLTKYLVVQNIGMGNIWLPLPVLSFLRIFPTINSGTACGYFPQASIIFTLAPFLILAVVIYFYRSQRQPSWLLSIGVGLIIGGAFGNLVDRLRFGYVVDFVQVGTFPIFNVADAAVSTAVVIMLLWSLREDSNKGKTDGAGTETTAARDSDSAWKIGLVFVGALAVVSVAVFFVCVYVPTNFLR